MKSPWMQIQPMDPGAEYLVLASAIPPKSVRSTFRLFQGSRAVRKQLLDTDGVMGFSMLAQPLRKYYATLSVWRDDEALTAFSSAHPHDDLMVGLAPLMANTEFVRWTITGADGVPTWRDALERLT